MQFYSYKVVLPAQFSAIPLNFLNFETNTTADYLVTGYWSEKAAKEAEKYGKVNWVVPKQDKYQSITAMKKLFLSSDNSISQMFQLKIHGN